MHRKRVITGLAILPVFLTCVFWQYGDWCSAIVAFLFFLAARVEIYNLQKIHPQRMLTWGQNFLAFLFLLCTVQHRITALITISFLFYWGSCLVTIHRSVHESRMEIATHGLALVYLLFPLASFVFLRTQEHGSMYLFFMLAVACFSDIGAYYGGHFWGRHKMVPIISPNKTWEGAISGALSAVAVIGLLSVYQSFHYHMTLWFTGSHRYIEILSVTLGMSIIGQIGDLCESAMKRDAGIKDSGITVTGHGGFLDMMDSMLWIGPAMFVYVMLLKS